MPKQKDGQVSGQWLLAKDGGYVHCSHCGYEPPGTPTPFCPNCGTKMSKESIKKVQKESEKKQYAEFVEMTEEECQKLVNQYGREMTARMIEVLDNYKGSSGKKYKSDYRAILTWVVGKVKKEFPNSTKEVSFDVRLAEQNARERPIDFSVKRNSRHKKTTAAN